MINKYKSKISSLQPLSIESVCDYGRWYGRFKEKPEVLCHIKTIEKKLGDTFTRKDIIDLCSNNNFDDITKFLSVMIWGHSSGKKEKPDPDNRGPFKVEQMTANISELKSTLANAKKLIHSGDFNVAYKKTKGRIPYCGPNFFSKYFYFIGKAFGMTKYPLIFDNRVASGLVKIHIPINDLLNIVSIETATRADRYVEYVDLIHKWAKEMKCEADQVELFLYNFGRQ